MNIGFKHLKDGTLMAYDKDTGKELGRVITMGDMITKDEAQSQ